MNKPLQTLPTIKALLVKIAGTPVRRTRQRIMQVKSPGSWLGNLTSTELAGNQSEEDRLKAGWGRDVCDQDFTTFWGSTPSNPHLVCWAHLGTCYIANLNLSIQNGSRDQGNTLNTLREAPGMLETDPVRTVAGLLDNSSSAQTMLNAKAS